MKRIFTLFVVLSLFSNFAFGQSPMRVATFDVDASPPIGSPLAYDPTIEIQTPLSCRGIVILSEQKPIVLCSVDWLGISNDAQKEFKQAFAKAAETTMDRVCIHVIHQHDAPRCDFTAEKILAEFGYANKAYDLKFCRRVISQAALKIKTSIESASPVTHFGTAKAVVEKVASNRRILGPDGKVKITRYTATKDPKIRAEPTGTIDPELRMISFWNEAKPVAVVTFYATHPQSYYRTGRANPDFPGIARNARQKATGVPHIHFNGAGGNIGAGKWNDGAKENRAVLAQRVEEGMKQAWKETKTQKIDVASLSMDSTDVRLPLARGLDEATQIAVLKSAKELPINHLYAAKHLAWIRRSKAKTPLKVSCLSINDSKTLFMPGELFVEYQLEAIKASPNSFVAMAAYGEYGMGYIGTSIAYSQGGYETSPKASRVGPGSEKILMDAVKKLLK